ncbi:MAG: alpha/beta hydrolase, partial [Fibrobacter sp.]|nr:alpha/beta hydrolase [Fibrobacter sp.]
GLRIWGELYRPENAKGKLPLAILTHGFNGDYREVIEYAEGLAKKGIAAYIFEFCGGSNHSRSEGKSSDMTIFKESGNVLSVVEMIKGWDWVDTTRLALLGCSQGGLVAATTTGANPDIFKCQVLVYPALTIPETASRMLPRFDEAQSDSLVFMNLMLGRCYYESISGFSVFENMPSYKGSTLTEALLNEEPVKVEDFI